MEKNLQQLIAAYGQQDKLPKAYDTLTPAEKLVASLVKQGLSTKAIALSLNISPGTINIHRKHIRKKLGLDNQDKNLRAYLLSLGE